MAGVTYSLSHLQIESRALCVHQWASPLGKTVLVKLSELYRALVWEGFILLAVAADEDKAAKEEEEGTVKSGSQSTESTSDSQSTTAASLDSVPMLSETHTQSSSVCSTNPSSSNDTESHSQAAVAVTLVESMDTSSTTSSKGLDSKSTEQSAVSSKPSGTTLTAPSTPSILVQSLKQLTPLLTITSHVGRSLAELMSLLVRISTSPLHRLHRRGPGHSFLMHSYHPPSSEAIAVCMEVTNLLVDSLNWEVPRPQAYSAAMQSPISDWLFAG